MVRPIGNAKFVCTKCGWSKSMYFKTDVVIGRPEECPKCGNKDFRLEVGLKIKKKVFDVVKFLRNS